MIEKDNGFLIKRYNFRDTSIIATIYASRFGKIRGILKGFYTTKREFASPLTACSLNEFVFYPKKSEIWLVSHVDLIRDHAFLRKDLAKAHTAWLFCHFIDKVMQIWDPNAFVFELFNRCLNALEQENNLKVMYIFLIKFLAYAGFKPETDYCINCRVPITTTEHFFSVAKGGFVCSHCRGLVKGFRTVSPESSRALTYIQNNDFDLASRLNVSQGCEEELLSILKEFTSYHFEFDLLGHIAKYRPATVA